MGNDLLFDLRKTSKAKKYVRFEKRRVRNDIFFLLFMSIIIVIGSIMWALEPNRPKADILILCIVDVIALISLVFVLYISPKKWCEKRIILPLIDSEKIFKEDSSGHIIERYPLSNISAIYSNPKKDYITILLTSKSQNGFTVVDLSKKQIIDVKLFFSVLKNREVLLINEEINSEIIRNHLDKYKQA